MSDLRRCKNLGSTIIRNLNKIGIYNYRDLKKMGAVKVYKKLTSKYPTTTWSVCYYLYSIEGAIVNKHWDDIGASRKKALLKAIQKK